MTWWIVLAAYVLCGLVWLYALARAAGMADEHAERIWRERHGH